MSSSQFESPDSEFTPFRATLTSFGTEDDDKAVKRSPFTLQANSGAGWVTLDADWYFVRRKSGYVEIRDTDDDGNDVDVQVYVDYQDLGNTAFRATYTVKDVTTQTTYTNEALTFAEGDIFGSVGDDGSLNAELARNLYVDEIHAEFGDIGGWQVGSTQITSDSGNVFLDSSVPSMGLGATGYLTGTGFWVGKSGGAYKMSIGDATNQQMYWDGTKLVAGGFKIGLDYIEDIADSFGMASTVSGSNDVRFWAGSTFASRASAPLQIYEDGYIFAKDIVLAKGSLSGASGATGYGYSVDPLFLCHYDGALPYYGDFKGSAIGHKGQVDTRAGGVIFRRGIFNKAVQIAEATTNLAKNPSAETTSNFAARGTATVTRDTATYLIGATSYKVVLAAGNDGVDFTTTALGNAVHYVTFWVTGSAIATIQVSLDGTNWNAITQLSTVTTNATTWTLCGVSILAAQANTSTTTRVRNTASSGTFYIDCVQVEQKTYPTPYCDGSLGDGHTWSGTAHASDSSRTAATLTYPATGNINLAQGSISFWIFNQGAAQRDFPMAIGLRIDANNHVKIHANVSSSSMKPYVETTTGGSLVTAIGNSTVMSLGWNHIAYTWAVGSNKLYVNGVLSGSAGAYTTPTGTLATIEVGTFNGGQQVNTWIDDLAIIPLVLTLNEIKSIYYSSAPLMLGVSNQELRLSGAGLGDVFGNANGLFGRGADGTPSFGLLNGTVNATTWGGASETFDAGDFMFGSNASGKNNIIFDASAGLLALRTGTTRKISADTSGTLLVGNDTTDPTKNALAVFSGSVTYNSESMAASNILLGDNSAFAINIKWTAAAGFVLREGTDSVATMNQYGIVTNRALGHAQASINVTSGNVDLDDGLHATMYTSYLRIGTSSGTFTIRGITPGAVSGQRLIIHNNSGNNMVIKDNGSPAVGYDIIRTLNGADVTSSGDGICELVYNDATTRWDLLSVGRGWS